MEEVTSISFNKKAKGKSSKIRKRNTYLSFQESLEIIPRKMEEVTSISFNKQSKEKSSKIRK